jgi:hypothetical protein
VEPYELELLLWDLRHDPSVVERARRDLDAVAAEYGVSSEHTRALHDRDYRALLAAGTSPLLLYFAALELGVSRDEYYRRVQEAPREASEHEAPREASEHEAPREASEHVPGARRGG